MLHCILLPALFAVVLAADADRADTPKADGDKAQLSIGDRAPKLETQEFVKGAPVTEFEKGKIYVVEFWATWCGPCRESIPHLTKLQKESKQVTFIGVSVDDDTKAVKPFVDKMADKMDYRVAIDARDGDNGRMAQAWLAASGQEGIPAAYVVNGDGRIAWIGHPGDIEEPLAQIVEGKWDLAAKVAEYKKAKAQERAIARLQDQLGVLIKRRDYAGAIKLLDDASKELDLKNDELLLVKLALLAGPGSDVARALSLGEQLYDNAAKGDDGGTLMMIAKTLADPQGSLPGGSSKSHPEAKVDSKLAALAVKAAEKGEPLTHTGNAIDDAQTAMLVAKAYRAAGQNERAATKLDDAANLVNQSIQAANDTLSEIRDLKASLGGGEPSQKVTEKPKSVEK